MKIPGTGGGISLADLREQVISGDPLDASAPIDIDIRLLSLGIIGSWLIGVLTGALEVFVLAPIRGFARVASALQGYATEFSTTVYLSVVRSFNAATTSFEAWAGVFGPAALPIAVLSLAITVLAITRVYRAW